MLIKQVKLFNFLCYSGENIFDFTEGLNIIIGDSGYGKSKLYDAFYWVLNDKIFDTGKKKFISSKLIGHELISDKAKHESVDNLVTAYVDVTFHDDRNDVTYVLQRKLLAKKHNDEWKAENNTELTIWKRESFSKSILVSDIVDKLRILKIILPEDIKPYMWFQGEDVETLIDFNEQHTLTKAINVLSNISRFDDFISISNIAYESANKEFNKELKRYSKDKNATDILEKDKDTVETKIKNLTIEEDIIKDNLSKAETRCEELLNKFDDAQTIKGLDSKRKTLIEQLDSLKNELLDEQVNYNKRLFKNKWLLKDTGFILEGFSEKFSNYTKVKLIHEKEEKHAEKVLRTRLPINVPEPIYIERMLSEERCLVCDREATKNSEAWLKIQELISRTTNNKIINNKHDFHNELNKLYHNGLALSQYIESIEEDINENLKRKNDIEKKIQDLQDKISEIEQNIDSILLNSSLTLTLSENILNEYNIQKDKITTYSMELQKIQNYISESNKKIDSINIELKGLVKGEMPSKYYEKVKTLKDFKELSKLTRDLVFRNLINILETEANKHYHSMTLDNKSVQGLIRLIELQNGNYMPQLKDDAGNTLLQLNTSNIIMIKLATIMAIISAKKGAKVNQLYTLISDAPMSVFGEAYTLGFCKTVSHVYRQSIITSKEFYSNTNLKNKLINSNDINLGKIYEITPSISEDERANRNILFTIINKLN
jgi:DNA sulfur modification protein DndD